MSIHYCLFGPDEMSRASFSETFRSEEFEIIGYLENLSQIGELDLNSDFLAVIYYPNDEFRLEVIKEFKSIFPSCSIFVLSESFDFESMIRCFELGADGYLIRSQTPSALIASLHLAIRSEKELLPKLADAFESAPIRSLPAIGTKRTVDTPGLSPRERDVLRCLMAGFSNKVIARQLDLCEATVKVHVKAILRKLQVLNRTQAAVWASSHGIQKIPMLS